MSEQKPLFLAQPTPPPIAGTDEGTTPVRLLFKAPATTTTLVEPVVLSTPSKGLIFSAAKDKAEGADQPPLTQLSSTNPRDVASPLMTSNSKFLPQLEKALTVITTEEGDAAVFFGSLDMSLMPARGHVKYAAQKFTREHLVKLQDLVSKSNPKAKTVLSDTRRFIDFLDCNPHVESIGAAIAQFASQAAGDIGPGSAANLAKNVMESLKAARVETGSLVLCNAVIDGLDRAYAEEGAQHAVDCTEEEARSWLPTDPPYRIRKVAARTLVWIMCTCGARCKDIIRAALRISLDTIQKRLNCVFQVTKAGQTVADKRTVSFPWFKDPDKEVIEFMQSEDFANKLPDTNGINSVLKAASLKFEVQKAGKAPRSVTSYTFRRLFIHRVIAFYTDDDGIVDWLKVIQWSGHNNPHIVSHTYSKGQVLNFFEERKRGREEPENGPQDIAKNSIVPGTMPNSQKKLTQKKLDVSSFVKAHHF